MSYPFARHLSSTSRPLTDGQKGAYEILRGHPGATAAELEKLAGDSNLHKRLSELYRLGLADKSSKRHCKVSKRKVDTWIAKPSVNS